jgi:hypothetical protein
MIGAIEKWGKAGPSTPLRFAQDDTVYGSIPGLKIETWGTQSYGTSRKT